MNRRFDVVVFGAAGYTGKLVAEYLLDTYGVTDDLRWALAGRDRAKLEKARDEVGAPTDLPLLIADVGDEQSLRAMCAETTVVATTVGPYRLYGSGLVAACADMGTDYVDITGESLWIGDMLIHDARAKTSGARIVFSCGFDSIPSELGVFVLQQASEKKFGTPAPRVRARVQRFYGGVRGGITGGSLATFMNATAEMQKNPELGLLMADPFALTPGFKGPEQPDGSAPYEDKVTGSWVAPFFMAAINSKVVHRCNYLLGHKWGSDFKYDEMSIVDGPPANSSQEGPPFAGPKMPKPGEGPSKADREGGCYEILFVAEAADGRTLRTTLTSVFDPGADSTARLMAESAVCLAKDVSRNTTPGGVWTAASAMGNALVKRLETNAGITFKTE